MMRSTLSILTAVCCVTFLLCQTPPDLFARTQVGNICTVYGQNGKTLSPCTNVGRQTVYPGDPRWPYTTPGVCDAVRDGKVVTTRTGG